MENARRDAALGLDSIQFADSVPGPFAGQPALDQSRPVSGPGSIRRNSAAASPVPTDVDLFSCIQIRTALANRARVNHRRDSFGAICARTLGEMHPETFADSHAIAQAAKSDIRGSPSRLTSACESMPVRKRRRANAPRMRERSRSKRAQNRCLGRIPGLGDHRHMEEDCPDPQDHHGSRNSSIPFNMVGCEPPMTNSEASVIEPPRWRFLHPSTVGHKRIGQPQAERRSRCRMRAGASWPASM